jgi:hypothetical protein
VEGCSLAVVGFCRFHDMRRKLSATPLSERIFSHDTSHFYAVSKIVGISAVYACVISDSVAAPMWEDGFARIQQTTSDLQTLILETLTQMLLEE